MAKLCPKGKAAAKRKFKVYPSAYANAYASKICAGKIKDPSGVKRKDFRGYEIPVLESCLRFAAPFMQGPFKNFRQIEAKQVAKSMVMDLLDKKRRESYLYYEDFLKTETFE